MQMNSITPVEAHSPIQVQGAAAGRAAEAGNTSVLLGGHVRREGVEGRSGEKRPKTWGGARRVRVERAAAGAAPSPAGGGAARAAGRSRRRRSRRAAAGARSRARAARGDRRRAGRRAAARGSAPTLSAPSRPARERRGGAVPHPPAAPARAPRGPRRPRPRPRGALPPTYPEKAAGERRSKRAEKTMKVKSRSAENECEPSGHLEASCRRRCQWGGLGISVGVVGPAAAPYPRSSATRPPPPCCARRRRRCCGDISPQRPMRHPALGAGIASAPHGAQPPPPPTPRYFFLLPASARGAHVHGLPPASAPPAQPSLPSGLRSGLRRRGAGPAPELGSRKQQRPPPSPRGRAGPLPRPEAAEVGRARARARRGTVRGPPRLGLGARRARVRLLPSSLPVPPAQVTGWAVSRRGAAVPASPVPNLRASTNFGDRILSH
nr:atherin-like [Manis javanica]